MLLLLRRQKPGGPGVSAVLQISTFIPRLAGWLAALTPLSSLEVPTIVQTNLLPGYKYTNVKIAAAAGL